jgi:hypothetical protein
LTKTGKAAPFRLRSTALPPRSSSDACLRDTAWSATRSAQSAPRPANNKQPSRSAKGAPFSSPTGRSSAMAWERALQCQARGRGPRGARTANRHFKRLEI